MKKIFVLPLLVLAMSTQKVFAINTEQSPGKAMGQSNPPIVSPTPKLTGQQVSNQMETKNQGEDKLIMIQEEENSQFQPEEQTAKMNASQSAQMQAVSQQVQMLLSTQLHNEGIGQQVREVAMAQQNQQTQIQEQLQNLDNRNKVLKFFFGADKENLAKLSALISENQARIEELTQLQSELTNSSDIAALQSTIDSLNEANQSLETRMQSETQTRSLFGWLLQLFQN